MLYWICFAVGGAFVVLAIVSGFDGADVVGGDFDADLDFHGEVGLDRDLDVEFVDSGDRPQPSLFARAQRSSPLSLLTSLKFWTFGLCFFGLTGLVLTQIGMNAVAVALIAAFIGILCGAGIALTLRVLRQRQSDSLVKTSDLTGIEGTVEIPFGVDSRGKVRLQIKGTVVDFIAYTNDPKPLEKGDRILVIGTENNRLWVVPADLPPVHSGD